MYACGHREGAFVSLWPGDILALAYALRSDAGFDVFLRVGSPRAYEENEELELSAADAERWLAETNSGSALESEQPSANR